MAPNKHCPRSVRDKKNGKDRPCRGRVTGNDTLCVHHREQSISSVPQAATALTSSATRTKTSLQSTHITYDSTPYKLNYKSSPNDPMAVRCEVFCRNLGHDI